MREHLSDGAKRHDHVRSNLKRALARYGGAVSVIGLIAAGCAAQDNGDEPGGGTSGTHNGGGSAGAAGSSGAGGANSGAGTNNTSAGSAGKGGTASNGGTASSGGMGGTADGGSAGKAGGGGSAGAGGSGNGGAAGMGGKGGSGGTGGGAGAGGKGGSGGSGGTGGSAGAAGSGGSGGAPGCKTLSDCATNNVCENSKCVAIGCNAGVCGYALTRFILGSGAKGQVVVTWDNDSLDLDFVIEDTTPFDDSALNWQDDSVEVYLDLNHNKMTAYDTDDFQITIPRNAGALSGGTNAAGTLNYNAIVVSNRKSDATGYSLSVSIPYSALNGAGNQTGKTIGFDIAVNDDTNGGDTREGQSMLYGSAENYHDTSQFGALTLTP